MQPCILVIVQRTSFEEMNCSVAQCLEAVGEWWSLLIIRDAFLGVTRFDDFQARLEISRNILNQRLNRLVDNDIFERVRYQDHPPRSEYRLTEKGRELWPIVTAMGNWGDRWAAPEGPPLTIRHLSCGQVVQAVPVCSHCGERLDARDREGRGRAGGARRRLRPDRSARRNSVGCHFIASKTYQARRCHQWGSPVDRLLSRLVSRSVKFLVKHSAFALQIVLR